MQWGCWQSPVGWISLVAKDGALVRLVFGRSDETVLQDNAELPLIKEGLRQLEAYFSGRLRNFDLSLRPQGTEFQRTVWAELRRIPYGETRGYGEIAAALAKPKAARAVGMANNRNPLPIIIPCHRVIGADGRLVGYSSGLELKRHLLELEHSMEQVACN